MTVKQDFEKLHKLTQKAYLDVSNEITERLKCAFHDCESIVVTGPGEWTITTLVDAETGDEAVFVLKLEY